MQENSKVVNLKEWQQPSGNGGSEFQQRRFSPVTGSGYMLVLAAGAFALFVTYQVLRLGVFANPVVFASFGAAAVYAIGGGLLIKHGDKLVAMLSGINRGSGSMARSEELGTSAEVLLMPPSGTGASVVCSNCNLHYDSNLNNPGCPACVPKVLAA